MSAMSSQPKGNESETASKIHEATLFMRGAGGIVRQPGAEVQRNNPDTAHHEVAKVTSAPEAVAFTRKAGREAAPSLVTCFGVNNR